MSKRFKVRMAEKEKNIPGTKIAAETGMTTGKGGDVVLSAEPEGKAAAGGQSPESNPLNKIKPRRIIYPVLIGLGVVGYMLYREFNPAVFNDVHFSWKTVFWLFMALMFMFGRDFGYIVRLRVLSRGELGWRQAFRIIMLWEFTSAVTPSAVGGTSVAVLYVHKEGISVGRSSAIVMLTSFLDELYFIVMFPLLLFMVGATDLFDIGNLEGVVEKGLMTFALIGYGIKFAYLMVLSYGLFINPRGLKWMLLKIFKLGVLRKWYRSVNNVGTDIINSSREIKNYGFRFWVKALASTFISWSSRYLVANALILAFFAVSDQFLLFARQLVMWIMMLIMPTPGGSGFAEYIFTTYCSDLILVPLSLKVGAATLIAFLWRGVTYFPYLIIGSYIFPKWVAEKFGRQEDEA